MTKILIAECKQEVSSFNPVLSQYEDFEILEGQEILNFYGSSNSEMGGALNVFADASYEVVPTYSARAITSGGILAQESFQRICQEFCSSLHAATHVDGVYLCLHGAMQAEQEHDPEGYLLTLMRDILGEAVPIVISMDLHGIPTARMLKACNALVAYHTYPHIDFFDTGKRAASLLLRLLKKEVKPVTAIVTIPALVRGDELITETGLFGKSIRDAKAIENKHALAAGMFIGNPFTDVADLASYSFVTTNDNRAQASQDARQLAEEFWAIRYKLQAPLIPLQEAVEKAINVFSLNPSSTLIFSDAADATSSGATGDSNAILRMLYENDYQGRALLPIVDANAVKMAFDNGIGTQIETSLGGSLDSRFEPLKLKARVRLLFDGQLISESHMLPWNAGDTAVLECGSLTVIVTSRSISLYDRSLFFAVGQNPKQFNLIVVKSPHCQPHFFELWADMLLNVDAPGSTSANLRTLGHSRCRRPMFPLDEEFSFIAKVNVFQRDLL